MNGRHRILIESACIVGLVLFIAVAPAAASSWTYTSISDPGLDCFSTSLSGNYLLYTASIGSPQDDNSTRVIRLYSRSAGSDTLLATSEPGTSLFGEDINGDYAVWSGGPTLTSAAPGPNRLYLYSLADGNKTTILAGEDASWIKVYGESMVWSEETNGSFASSLVLYTISTGNRTALPGVRTYDPAGVSYNGRYILYPDANSLNLSLYEPGTGVTTTVFTPSDTADTREVAFGAALSGDYVLYRKDVQADSLRERYSELCLYRISTGKTVLLSPTTGSVVETLTSADKQADFTVQGADTTRVVWDVTEGIADDRIMVLDPSTLTVSSVSPKMFVHAVRIDGRNLAWVGTKALFGKGTVYLATETTNGTVPTSPAAGLPVDSVIIPVAGIGGAFAAWQCLKRLP